MGQGAGVGRGDAVVRLVTTLGLYAVLAGGAFFALGAVWPHYYHAHADGQMGMGTSLLGLGAILLGALLVSVSLGRLLRSRLSVTGRRVLRWVVLVAVLSSALAAGLVVLGGVDAMDGRAVGSFALMGVIAGALSLVAPRVSRDHIG